MLPPHRRSLAPVTKRIVSLVATMVIAVALCGCQEAKPGPSAIVTGSQNVQILSAQMVSTNDAGNSVGGQATWYLIAKIQFTNTYNIDFAPIIAYFTLQDPQANRYQAFDSGSTALVGISNFGGVLKKDEKHEYTIGFRVSQGTTGFIFYQP